MYAKQQWDVSLVIDTYDNMQDPSVWRSESSCAHLASLATDKGAGEIQPDFVCMHAF